MLQRISLLTILITLVSCDKNSKPEYELIQSSEWLLGKWEQTNVDGILSENWTKVNDSTYNGSSLFLKGKDTIHKETMVLQETAETLTYKTTIYGQNNDEPILFLAKESEENQMVFENLNNDYPQKIKYSQPNASLLLTEMSGIQLGNTTTEKYSLKKVK
ncbi:DUF6265 family protein [Flavobacterium sp. 7A]|uniref:DUF6265 family protein n=1 Tax=Flavobacterium sp. 7A TaxID=2940571 RepID=UPI002226EE58|nr:DUF6265 family protein [Flavobacterium sp. 7A]MCW2121236.1 hypothetical protein [Flavobacterium sp. 7A]